MKKLLGTILFIAAMAAYSNGLHAQSNEQRMTREQLAETQARHIADELAMDDATSEKFVATYCQFQKELWQLGPRQKGHRPQTEAETKEAINEHFEHSQKILDLRKKYYDIYSEFLTQKQIQKVYETERDIMKHLRNRAPMRPGKRP